MKNKKIYILSLFVVGFAYAQDDEDEMSGVAKRKLIESIFDIPSIQPNPIIDKSTTSFPPEAIAEPPVIGEPTFPRRGCGFRNSGGINSGASAASVCYPNIMIYGLFLIIQLTKCTIFLER